VNDRSRPAAIVALARGTLPLGNDPQLLDAIAALTGERSAHLGTDRAEFRQQAWANLELL
jgi:hypothetical protein